MAYATGGSNQRGDAPLATISLMLPQVLSTALKIVIASLIVGATLSAFGISAEQLLKDAGLTPDRLMEAARGGFAWALPNVLLGALVIVPIWIVAYLFRPPSA